MEQPKVLFAWELGANFGHAGEINAVARHLTSHCDVTIAAQDVAAIRHLGTDLDIRLIAAPYTPPKRTPPGVRHHNYADILRTCGWNNPHNLSALVEAWRALFDLVQPDLIVAQSAPTALLAARGTGIKTAMFGSGYNAPPRSAPMPPFFHWEPNAADGLWAHESDILANANAAIAPLGVEPLATFSDVLDTDAYFVTTIPELDHYTPRARFEPGFDDYVGHLTVVDQGAEKAWRPNVQHRIFAYLRPNSPTFEAGLRALVQLDPKQCHVILSAPGISKGLTERLADTAVDVTDGPVRLDSLLKSASLAVHHSSNGTSCAALFAGVPQIGLPNHTEQTMCAHAMGQAKLGLALVGKFGGDEVLNAIRTVLNGPDYRQRAEAHARSVLKSYPEDPGLVVAERLMALIAS